MIQKLKYVLVFAVMVSIQGAMAQTITGTVSDEAGTPLPGVNIVEKGTNNGVTSDFDGNYGITVSDSGATLVFSYLGYQTIEIPVSGRTTIDLTLQEDTELLDEVVVTALGISREKKSLGYAVTEVESEQINTVKDYNVANSLVGKVAGLVVNQSGGVGSSSRIVLRGNNSITGNNQALIVVDGIPIDMSDTSSGGSVYSSTVTGGGITDLNPEDIESVSVLKGPNAAALYGSRAASGVLLITTKKGSKGRGLGISFNSNVTLENPMFLPEYQNEYGQGTNGAPYPDVAGMGTSSWGSRMDGTQQIYFTGEQKAYSAQPNNVEDYFETGEKLINSVSVDKGGDDYSMRFSYTNNSTTSIIPNSKLNSHNFNLRTLVDISDKLSFDGKATYFTQELNNRVNLGSEGVLGYVYYMPRSVDVNDLKTYQIANPALYDPNNGISEYDVISYSGSGKSIGNPYWIQYEDTNDQRRDRFIGFGKVNYEFNDWLSAFIRVGGDVTNVRTDFINPVGHHFNRYGRVEFNTDKYTEMNSDFLITANKDFGEKINLTANVGGNLSKRTAERMGVVGSQFKIPTRALLANTNIQSSTHTPMETKKVNSLYGSVSLGYDNFMYLDLTARNDWSSTLAADNRSYFYPSASFALLLDRFIDPERNVVDMFKLRTSWAEVGNDTGVYQLYQTFDVPQQGYLGLTTLSAPDIRYNEDLKPESVKSVEFGAEGRFFKNRLYFDLSVYNITTNDMIYDLPVPAATGFNFYKSNIGEVQNKGVEFLIGGMPVRTEDFSWDVSFNFSKNKNTVNSLIEGLDGTILNTTNSGNVAIAANVGGGIGDIYGTVWATDDDGNRLVNAEGIPMASSERELLGNAQPDWIGGLTNTISYKNLSLRFLIDGRVGGEIYSVTSASLDGAGVSERSLLYRDGGVVVDAINSDTGSANTESITAQEYWGAVSGIAENYVYEQTNVRLREFAFTYNFSRDLVQKIGLNSASLGLIGRNLFFFYKKADDIDPDATLGTGLNGQGISINNVPTVRSLGLNLNLKL
ncbi:SusC/RagA family TonB-linked outer membrane protein [Muricauda sp. MAR_2010_75]|jgi:TonB-linked SusC/RagA family outer membrane protein|uniref:SusC/RagA family TonB-linked outer membrane protein n=1 Tax=Allomuricauda sp. MAR_2010_75 TaxID=1250232 RepID=UPI000562E124|nr:SusC/RagA family TonB-linked outer membrane protein [Muricauda sp. MAR_2010_75]